MPVSNEIYFSIIAMIVILGHDYTPFLGFNGGKGVNTTIGAFFFLAPIATLAAGLIVFRHKGNLTKVVQDKISI